jgi:hypothetical protein
MGNCSLPPAERQGTDMASRVSQSSSLRHLFVSGADTSRVTGGQHRSAPARKALSGGRMQTGEAYRLHGRQEVRSTTCRRWPRCVAATLSIEPSSWLTVGQQQAGPRPRPPSTARVCRALRFRAEDIAAERNALFSPQAPRVRRPGETRAREPRHGSSCFGNPGCPCRRSRTGMNTEQVTTVSGCQWRAPSVHAALRSRSPWKGPP